MSISFRSLFSVLPLFLAAVTPALGQSSLGLSQFEAEAGLGSSENKAAFARLTGDFRITSAHGMQADLSATDYNGGYLGQLDGHLYLAPSPNLKYGLFASLADVNGREATVALAGAEGLFALSDRTVLEARAVIGYARPGNLDFIAASARLDHALTDQTSIYAEISLAEVDEMSLRALAHRTSVGLRHHLSGIPVELNTAIVTSGLSGRDAAPSATSAEIGVTWRFGSSRRANRPLVERSFSRPAPFDPLLTRGSF